MKKFLNFILNFEKIKHLSKNFLNYFENFDSKYIATSLENLNV